ncbi:hypothetical protein [Antrihabitans cavernicola]|uniref:Uncharacterized protein n=1 Tax=Antrihabitans cavernicola TaxID=2495913 RepID=A0A5A7SEM3_9NOCA|nr:hypothetical protein [Spelaeibacter cavernicola]KAA0022985.1 hypothetical protein FOY51_10820 [Spelaeibacter cavernicola]
MTTTMPIAREVGQNVRVHNRIALLTLAVAGFVVFGSGLAQADPVTPDPNQPANGFGVVGPLLTGPMSPVQLPAPTVTTEADTTTVTAHPFLAPWVHAAIPIDPDSVVELHGAARVTVPDLATGGRLVINPNGHCIFVGADAAAGASTETALAPVRIDTPAFALTIEPSLRHR